MQAAAKPKAKARISGRAVIRMTVFAAVFLALGFVAGVFWDDRAGRRNDPVQDSSVETTVPRGLAIDAQPPSRPVAARTDMEADVVEEVKRLIPNLDSLSVEQGTRILRERALRDFEAAANEMKSQVSQAQQRVAQARNGGSEAEVQTALTQLRQIQTEQTDQLQRIAGRLQIQIETLNRLKGVETSPSGVPPGTRRTSGPTR